MSGLIGSAGGAMQQAVRTGTLLVLMLLFAAPVPARAEPGACYPPPCNSPRAVAAGSQPLGTPIPLPQVGGPDTETASAPFVAVGLLMVLTSFGAIVTRRRSAIARRPRPAPVSVAVAEHRTPERILR